MLKGSGRTLGGAFTLLAAMSIAGPPSASAQVLAVGGHASLNPDLVDDNTLGVGLRAHVALPLTGVAVQATYDFYGPDCGVFECDVGELGLNLLWSLPVPYFFNPYVGAGGAFRKWTGESQWGTESHQGMNFLAGLVLQGPTFRRFQPFIEAKYQVWNDTDNQKVLSGGILLNLF
jgi:hypothetical protein